MAFRHPRAFVDVEEVEFLEQGLGGFHHELSYHLRVNGIFNEHGEIPLHFRKMAELAERGNLAIVREKRIETQLGEVDVLVDVEGLLHAWVQAPHISDGLVLRDEGRALPRMEEALGSTRLESHSGEA